MGNLYLIAKNLKQRIKGGTVMIDDGKKALIENKVNDIITEYGIGVPLFDLTKFLIEKEGFQICQQSMDDDTTGILFINDENFVQNTNSHKLILVNGNLMVHNDFKQRRRFIIAHEYGHYILHKNDSIQYAHRDTCKRESAQEQEADYFARCLLMPEKAFKAMWNAAQTLNLSIDENIKIIARLFNVTQKKARQRLHEDLQLI